MKLELSEKNPKEMSFDEAVNHIKRAIFWDYIDGQWLDLLILTKNRFDAFMRQLTDAHLREIAQHDEFYIGQVDHNLETLRKVEERLYDENAKLRELASGLIFCIENTTSFCNESCPLNENGQHRCLRLCKELGIEVGK